MAVARAARRAVAPALTCALLACLPTVTRAAPTPAHATVTRFGNELGPVSCPTPSECVVVDGGDAYRLNPAAPGHPVARPVDRADLNGIACPSAAQCTAVDDAGDEVTFDPGSSRAPTRVRIDPGTFAYAVACPTTTQCTATDGEGDETTFDPLAPGRPSAVRVDPDPDVTAITCPSTAQCTLVGNEGEEISFDPAAPGAPPAVGLTGGRPLTGVACPTTSQCTATGLHDEVTFDPENASPPTPRPVTVERSGELEAIACPAASQCTAVAGAGRGSSPAPSFDELGFDPASPGTPVPTLLAHGLPSPSVVDIACPSPGQCTAVFNGEAVTFDPAAPGVIAPTVAVIGARGARIRLACAGASACAGRLSLRARAGVLATGRYRVPAGARRLVGLRLRHAVHRHRRATLTVTVAGGVTVRRVITVS